MSVIILKKYGMDFDNNSIERKYSDLENHRLEGFVQGFVDNYKMLFNICVSTHRRTSHIDIDLQRTKNYYVLYNYGRYFSPKKAEILKYINKILKTSYTDIKIVDKNVKDMLLYKCKQKKNKEVKRMTKNGQLRAWHIVNGEIIDNPYVSSIEEAKDLINKWTDDDLQNPYVSFNAMGLEEYDETFKENDGWCEYYDENGLDINEIMENEADLTDFLSEHSEELSSNDKNEYYTMNKNNIIENIQVEAGDVQLTISDKSLFVEDIANEENYEVNFSTNKDLRNFLINNKIKLTQTSITDIGKFFKPDNKSNINKLVNDEDKKSLFYFLTYLQSKKIDVNNCLENFDSIVDDWNKISLD